MPSFQPSPNSGAGFDREMFREQEHELERVAEQHRIETGEEPEPGTLGRLIARVRRALRRP